jgi:hypothetical protein
VVDAGSDGENTIALWRRVESGEVVGPRVITAGIPLFPAHALPYYLDVVPAEGKAKMAEPETAADAATEVDKNRAAGYDIVKLFTGSIVSPDHIAPMPGPIARAAVDEAWSAGSEVWRHADAGQKPGGKAEALAPQTLADFHPIWCRTYDREHLHSGDTEKKILFGDIGWETEVWLMA